jgi:hypothetical protein
MSETDVDIDIPRDPATGQFAADNAERFGLAGVEDDSNYVPLTAPPQIDEIEGDPESVRAAFDDFVERGGDVGEPDYEPTPVYWQKTDGSGEPIAPNITTTVEQAGAAMSAYESNVGRSVEGIILDSFVADVDAARAEALKANPADAAELGLDPAEVSKNAQKNEEPAAEKSPSEINEAARQYVAQQPVDGLDPKVAEAMAHPQVRQAIEQELGKASAAQQAADVQRNVAYSVNQQAILAIAPELEGLEPHQWPDAIKVLAQIDPARTEKVINLAQRGAAIEMQLLQEAQQREAVQAQQFQAYKVSEEAKFNAAVGNLSQSDYEAVRSYATGVLGLTPQDVSALQNNPVAVDHRFQRALLDASRFHAMQSAAKPLQTRSLPPVIRPGTTSAAPRDDNGAKIAALSRQLDAAPTEAAQLKIAEQILRLRSA